MIIQILFFIGSLIVLFLVLRRFLKKQRSIGSWLVFEKSYSDNLGSHRICYWAKNRINHAITSCHNTLVGLQRDILNRSISNHLFLIRTAKIIYTSIIFCFA